MKLLDELERRIGRFALPHLTIALVLCQIVVYVFGQAKPDNLDRLYLVPDKVLAGEFWRLFTFLIVPPGINPFFAFFYWYLFYLMGTALEHYWGVFRYNIFLLIGFVATVGVSFLQPDQSSSNAFVQGSVFLAFAYLYPDFELYLFFILPVKIKWFALITWIGYLLVAIFGSWLGRLLVLASISNFLLFFGKDIYYRMLAGRRRMASQATRFAQEDKPFHCCAICGITDKTNPKMDFRYCSKCEGTCCYCSDHLLNHEHVARTGNAAGT